MDEMRGNLMKITSRAICRWFNRSDRFLNRRCHNSFKVVCAMSLFGRDNIIDCCNLEQTTLNLYVFHIANEMIDITQDYT